MSSVCNLAVFWGPRLHALASSPAAHHRFMTGKAEDRARCDGCGAGRRRYAAALEQFLQALTAPSMVVNAITVAAYKKYVLVSLLHAGELTPLPKHAPSVNIRNMKQEAASYQVTKFFWCVVLCARVLVGSFIW
jgi:hypothetical protein